MFPQNLRVVLLDLTPGRTTECKSVWKLTWECTVKQVFLLTWLHHLESLRKSQSLTQESKEINQGFSSVAQSCPTLCNPTDCSMQGFPVHHQLLQLAQTHVHRVSDASNHFNLWCSLLFLPSIFPSITVFSKESVLRIRYCIFSLSINPFNEYSGLISFKIDWLDLLAVQGTLKSLLQCHSSKASFLQYSNFFIVQLSHPYMTIGKSIALTRRTFVDKVMSLLFNMLSRLVITFLPKSKHLWISWFHSPYAVILEPPEIKSVTVSTSICHEVMGPDVMILVFWMLSFMPTFLLSSFTFIKRHFSSSSLSATRVVSSVYLRLLTFFLAILIPACASSSPVFLML